jgi:hypothetical protein
MSTNAICGRTCNITIGSNSYSAHKFDYSLDGKEDDVTAFGSSQFGDWLYCLVNATVSMECYELPNLVVDDIVTVIMTFGFTPNVTLTSANARVKTVKNSVDAKGIAQFTVEVRLTEVPTIGS